MRHTHYLNRSAADPGKKAVKKKGGLDIEEDDEDEEETKSIASRPQVSAARRGLPRFTEYTGR